MPDRQTKPPSFESALAEFETLVEKMEGGDLSLEDSVRAYERGVALHRYCEQALSTAERKIRILTEGSGESGSGETLEPFEAKGEDPDASAEGKPAASPPRANRPRAAAAAKAPEAEEDGLPF